MRIVSFFCSVMFGRIISRVVMGVIYVSGGVIIVKIIINRKKKGRLIMVVSVEEVIILWICFSLCNCEIKLFVEWGIVLLCSFNV